MARFWKSMAAYAITSHSHSGRMRGEFRRKQIVITRGPIPILTYPKQSTGLNGEGRPANVRSPEVAGPKPFAIPSIKTCREIFPWHTMEFGSLWIQEACSRVRGEALPIEWFTASLEQQTKKTFAGQPAESNCALPKPKSRPISINLIRCYRLDCLTAHAFNEVNDEPRRSPARDDTNACDQQSLNPGR